MVYWDSTNKLIKFIGQYDKNYSFSLYAETATNLITTRAMIQVRYVIPNGGGAGVDLIFPFVDTATPYADLGEATVLANGIRHLPLTLIIPVGLATRTNGVRVEIRLSNSLITLQTALSKYNNYEILRRKYKTDISPCCNGISYSLYLPDYVYAG